MNIIFRYINILYGLALSIGFSTGIPFIIAGGKKRWIIEVIFLSVLPILYLHALFTVRNRDSTKGGMAKISRWCIPINIFCASVVFGIISLYLKIFRGSKYPGDIFIFVLIFMILIIFVLGAGFISSLIYIFIYEITGPRKIKCCIDKGSNKFYQSR